MPSSKAAPSIQVLIERKALAEREVYQVVDPVIDLLTGAFKARVNVDDVYSLEEKVYLEFHVFPDGGIRTEYHTFSFPVDVIDRGERKEIEDHVYKQYRAIWN